MSRLITDWSTDDPQIAKALKDLAALPEYSAERHEAEAGLHMLQARWAWRRADEIRASHRQADARKRARARSSDEPAEQ